MKYIERPEKRRADFLGVGTIIKFINSPSSLDANSIVQCATYLLPDTTGTSNFPKGSSNKVSLTVIGSEYSMLQVCKYYSEDILYIRAKSYDDWSSWKNI